MDHSNPSISPVIKPQRLNKGQGIGIIAPAGPVTQPEIQPGLDLLKKLDYTIIPSPNLYNKEGYLAGNDDIRLEDLQLMLNNRDIQAIFCARGGYGTLRLLDKIDFDLIRRNPKIIVGYSDITALLLAIFKKTGLVTFHGPVVKEFSKNNIRNLESVFQLVSSDGLLNLDLSGGKVLYPGKAVGTIMGGNLSIISHLIGTPFMPSLKDAVLFIEEKGEPLYRIDRMLTHLKLSGILNGLAGFIWGVFEECGDVSAIDQLLADILSDMEIPSITGLPVGHGQQNITIPIGLQAVLDTELMTLSISEPCVET